MKLSAIFTICLLTCTLGFAQDVSVKRSLPSMIPSQCSAPAQIQGQVAVDNVVARINEAGHTFKGMQGGCGHIILTKEQRDNFPTLLLADAHLDQSDAKCDVLNSSNVDEPFGLSTEVKCFKTIKSSEDEPFVAYLVIGIKIDIDGEVIVYFVTASE